MGKDPNSPQRYKRIDFFIADHLTMRIRTRYSSGLGAFTAQSRDCRRMMIQVKWNSNDKCDVSAEDNAEPWNYSIWTTLSKHDQSEQKGREKEDCTQSSPGDIILFSRCFSSEHTNVSLQILFAPRNCIVQSRWGFLVLLARLFAVSK